MLRQLLEVSYSYIIQSLQTHWLSFVVSIQTLTASVQSIVDGLKRVNEEIREVQKARIPTNDNFLAVMQVSILPYLSRPYQLDC